jgi:hypothetical protein
MEEQMQNLKIYGSEEKSDLTIKNNKLENIEDEINNLLPENDNTNIIQININKNNNFESNKERNIKTKNSMNNININTFINIEENKKIKDENLIVGDYLITIQYTKYLHIPYFIFGNILNFYCPCYKFKSNQIYLSQMPTPPFGIVITQCKKD